MRLWRRRRHAVLEVCQAFAGLRWADTKYPDPHDLPALNTLPNIWKFFDKTKGTKGIVTNKKEWAERKQEILELAQFYEYGYKPKLGVDYTITITDNSYNGTGNPSVGARVTPTNVRFTGGVYQDVSISVALPSNVPESPKAPIAFGGNWTANSIANVAFPQLGVGCSHRCRSVGQSQSRRRFLQALSIRPQQRFR